MDQDSSAVVRSLFEAFNDDDIDRAVDLVSTSFELVDFAAGQTFHGPEGCRQWLQAFRTALPDAQTELVQVFAEGERVATEHIGRGIHRGPGVSLQLVANRLGDEATQATLANVSSTR